jgi:uncharacterized protein YidB (DUF937 family)
MSDPGEDGEGFMSILDTIAQKLTGSSPDSSQAMVGHLTDLVNSPEIGGFQGLMDKFHSNGLGDMATSLVSGTSQSVTPEHLTSIFGQDRLNALASKIGMEPEKLIGLVSQYLPVVMSKLSALTASAPKA